MPGFPARAQDFPSRPIRGSRLVGEAMGRRLNQAVVMDNKRCSGR